MNMRLLLGADIHFTGYVVMVERPFCCRNQGRLEVGMMKERMLGE